MPLSEQAVPPRPPAYCFHVTNQFVLVVLVGVYMNMVCAIREYLYLNKYNLLFSARSEKVLVSLFFIVR